MKCRIQLSPNPECLDANSDVDWLGNNAAFKCPACGNVFIVTNWHNADPPRQSKAGFRKCPRCEMSVAHVTGSRRAAHEENTPGEAWIEWPVENGKK